MSEGDSAAVQECIARYGGLVWSLARRVGLNDADAEDAVHEIFTEVWRSGHRYDPSIASETAFIATIARRRLIDRRRRMGREPQRQQVMEDSGATPAAGLPKTITAEEAGRAAEAFQALSPEQQRVLRLSVYEGLSHELIARATGLPLGTVKTHARRGLIKLRDLLSREGVPAPSSDGELAKGGEK